MNLPELKKPRKGEDYKAYYQRLKEYQLAERDRQFYLKIAQHNPYSSKNPVMANQKEREIWRQLFFQKFGRQRVLDLLERYVIPCSEVEPELQQILTDDLLISCIGKLVRKYNKVRATELGGNKFKWYLMKENWKRESANHLIWKFELKHLTGCMIERHDNDTQGRFDAVWNINKRKIFIEIVCKRQSIDQAFLNKTEIKMMSFVENKHFLVILAPQRLHRYFRGAEEQFPRLFFLANSKTILPLLERLSKTSLST
jgi:hypothetical protein